MSFATFQQLIEETLTASEFAAILKISKRTLYRKRSKGEIPAPVHIGSGTVRWRTKDVRDFLSKLKAS